MCIYMCVCVCVCVCKGTTHMTFPGLLYMFPNDIHAPKLQDIL